MRNNSSNRVASVGVFYLATFLIFSLVYAVAFYLGGENQKSIDNNKIVFVWEGLEKDIPCDGSYIQISGTDENTVYLNAIDE